MSHIHLKDLLVEAHLYSYTTSELLDKILAFKGKTLVFLDTETVGLNPNVSYLQLTQISAMAFDGSTMEKLGEYSEKAKIGYKLNQVLNDPNSYPARAVEKLRQKYLKRYHDKHPDVPMDDAVILKKAGFMHPSEALELTKYYSSPANMSEAEVLEGFVKFLSQFQNVVLIIHNASFDMKTIQARLRYNRLPRMNRYPVIDTLKISRYFFIPIFETIESSNPEAKDILQKLIAKTKFKSYASSLSKLAAVFDIKSTGWHDAREDILMLFQLFHKFIEILQSNRDLDIRKTQGLQAKRLRKMR